MSFSAVSPVEKGGSWLEVDPEYTPGLQSFPPISPVENGGSWLEFEVPPRHRPRVSVGILVARARSAGVSSS